MFGASRVWRCVWAVLAAACSAAGAQGPPSQLDAVEVVGIARRMPRGIDETAASVSVIDRNEIERAAASDLREVLRYEPGVTVEGSAGRFGLGDVVIRGIGGNRVLMQVDGIRVPDSYRVGRFSSASRNQFDLTLLQRIEILRGPGSALYGSDALGGVVALSTIDPADILGGAAGLEAELGGSYASASDRYGGSAVLAGERDAVQALFGYQRSEGHETGNQGEVDVVGRARTVPDPQNARNESLLGKLVYQQGRARWRLTLERNEQQVRTEVLSLNPQSSRTTLLTGDDSSRRQRASLDADVLDVGALARVRALVYAQDSRTINDTVDVRSNTTAVCLSAPGPITCRRDVQFRYRQTETGASVLAEAAGQGYWLFGLEAARIDYEEIRTGTQTNLNTGEVGSVVGGEQLPTRDFPLTTSDRFGAFVQNELRLADGRLELVPALRFDSFRIRGEPDPVFSSTNPGRPVAESSDSAVSPKLGALYRMTPEATLVGQLATGFRAPPAADLNLGLSSLPAGYAVVPNPVLRPERSSGAEIGVRGRWPRFGLAATAFYTDYDDLIISRAPLPCPGDPACVPGATGTFQSQNIASARIYGFEADARFRFDPAWSIRGLFSTATGTDLARDRPLNTIEPPRAVIGLHYDEASLSAALNLTHTWAKNDIDRSAGDLFALPAVTVVDLNVSWPIGPRLRLSAGVFNLFDRRYWLWSDVRNVVNPGGTVDRYTQPGRNFSVLLRGRL